MRVADAVGVQRRHRSGVTGVHGLEHVQRFAATALADDDSLRPHTQGVSDQVAGGDRTLVLNVRRPGLQPDHVVLLQLQFGRVFDRHHALVVRDEARHRVRAASSCREPVPPEMTTFSRALMQASSSMAISGLNAL